MITNKQIWDDEEWIRRLEQIHKLYYILSEAYWYNNYVNWLKGSIFEDIKKRQKENQNKNSRIKELEDFILNI